MSAKPSHHRIIVITGIVAVIMFGFCFAMVPLYNLLCQRIGINTSIAGAKLITPATSRELSQQVDLSRDITVQFTTTNHNGMPWDFYPQVKSVHVHPGETTKVLFIAKNPTANNMIAQAIPSMTPPQAVQHFHKVQCFCFDQQPLKAGEHQEMAMVFQIDKQLPKDIHVLTLAYTLYDVTPTQADKG